MEINELQDILKAQYPLLEAVEIRSEDLVFEERVRLKCFQCSNYRKKWTCPGNLTQLDFRKIISEYEHLAVVSLKRSAVSNQESGVSGQQSAVSNQQSGVSNQESAVWYREAGNELHRAMLYLETEMMKRNNALAQSFIGGSCELCEGGCPADKCAHPEQARVPWDATGCNVVRTLANIGIHVDFTGKDICRYGLFVW